MEIWMTPRGAALFIVALAIVAGIGIGVFHAIYVIDVEYRYRVAIGANIDNAFDASSFEVMKDNLLKAKAGMLAQHLEPTDCGRAFSWERTQDWCMAYTYQYLDGLVNRTGFYIDQMTKLNQTQFTDIYTQAINNMRSEMTRNGPVDWAAQPTWMLKYAPLYYWGGLVWLAFMAIPILAFVFLVAFVNVDDDPPSRSRRR